MPDEGAAQGAAFDAFISYSRVDIRLARALHAALERYQVPSSVRPSRRIAVFRDETDITGTKYFQSIAAHLSSSNKLLLICSPAARRSEYVTDEIERFLAAHSADDIVPVLASGQPNNEARSEELKAFPDLLGDMPLAANLTAFEPRRHRLQDPDWSEPWHLILANLLGVPRDVFAGELDASRELARAEAIRLWEIANARSGDGNVVEALLHAAAGHAILPDSPLKNSLSMATLALFPSLLVDCVLETDAALFGLALSGDGSQAMGWTADGAAWLTDTASGKVLASASHPGSILNATFLRDGSALTYGSGRMTIVRPDEAAVSWDAPFFIARVLEAPVGDLLGLAGAGGEVCLWSRQLAGPTAPKKFWGGNPPLTMFTSDGNTLLAIDGSSLLQMERTGAGTWIQLPEKLRIHQAVPAFEFFLVSNADSIRLVAWLGESGDIGTALIAKHTSEVLVAKLSPNLKKLCWIGENHVLHSRDWFMYRTDDDSVGDGDDGRVSVQLRPDEYDLDFWNGDAVVVAYGRRGASAISAAGAVLWERDFDRPAAAFGCSLHHDLGLLTHVDVKQSRITYIDLVDGRVIESRRAVRPAGYVHSGGGRIAAASGESAVRLTSRRRRVSDDAVHRYYGVAHTVEAGDRVLVAFAAHDRSLRILDAVSGEPAFPVMTPATDVAHLFVTPDRRTALMLDEQRRLRLWRAHESDAREIALPLDVPTGKTSVAPAGDLIVVSTGIGISVLAAGDRRAEVINRMDHAEDQPIVHLQLGPGGELASASQTVVRLWDAKTAKPVGTPTEFDAPVLGIAFAPGGRKFFAWSLDNSFVIVNIATGETIRRVHPGPATVLAAGIRSVTASSDGSLLFTAGPDRCVRIWDMETGDEVAEPAVHPFPLSGIAPSDNVERILTWGADVVSVWNPWTGSKTGPDIEVADLARAAFWTLDNERVAVMEETSVSLFDPETALLVAGPWHHRGKPISARFVDSTLVTWTRDGLASVWELDGANGILDWRPACERATSVAFDINRRVVSPMSAADHALLETTETRSTLDVVYGRGSASRAGATRGFPSTGPVTEEAVRDFLVAEGLFDAVINPVGRSHPVMPFDRGNDIRRDAMVQPPEALMWQLGGSDPLDFDGAIAYVESMNAARFAGFDDWRLPRVYEAAATLSPFPVGGLYVAAGLGHHADIWTADCLDDGARWVVHFGAGRVGLVPRDSAHCVRLVRSHEEGHRSCALLDEVD